MTDWQPIESAPLDKWALLWWIPSGAPNPYAEAVIVGQVSSHEPGKYWDGHYEGGDYMKGYKDLANITHWMPLPEPPPSRR